jgi:HEAT repeat protein
MFRSESLFNEVRAMHATFWFRSLISTLAIAALVLLGPSDSRALGDSEEKKLPVPAIDRDLADVIRALKDPSPQSRARAAEDICQFGLKAKEAVAILIAAAKDEHVAVRRRAITALGAVGAADSKTVVPVLINALKDPDRADNLSEMSISERAIVALARIGPDAAPAIGELIKLIETGQRMQRGFAVSALGSIDSKDKRVVPKLLEVLKGEGEYGYVIGSAAGALGGLKAKEAVAPLVEILMSQELNRLPKELRKPEVLAQLRGEAAWALGQMGEAAKEKAVPALAEIVRDEKLLSDLRDRTADALGNLGQNANAAVPALVEVMTRSRTASRERVCQALGKIGRGAVPALYDVLRLGKSEDRLRALYVFRIMGPEAKDAREAVEEACMNRDRQIAGSAKQTLKLIHGKN